MSLDSPFAHRIGTNYVPRPDEEANVRNVIEQQCTTIRKLESEAADIDKAIAQLEARKRENMQRRDSHQMFADAHRTLLSSILRLSPDILSEIFMRLAPDSSRWSIHSQIPPHPIVQLTHVCRQFRAIALSTSMLWTTFSMTDVPLPSDASQRTLQTIERRMGHITDMLSTFIHRAGTSPMTIHIGAKDQAFASNAQACTRILEPFVRLLREVQWKRAEIFLLLRHTASPLLQFLEITRHSHETLQAARFLIVAEVPPIVQEIVEHLDLQNATQLTYLGLGMPARAVLDARISWTALTEIMLHGATQLPLALGVLGKCPNLTRCTIELDSRASSTATLPPDLPQLITLPHLQKLILSGFQPTAHFPQALSLPSLRLLDIRDKMETFKDHLGYPPLDAALPEWIRLHGTQLTHLTFSYARITLSTLLSCLEGTPNLLSLELRPPLLIPLPHFAILIGDGRLTNFPLPALLAMTAWPDETGECLTKPCLCPKLERIIIYGPQIQTVVEYWADFVSSRRRDSRAGVGYVKGVDVCFQALDINGVESVNRTRKQVYDSLRARGVSLDGINFYVHQGALQSD